MSRIVFGVLLLLLGACHAVTLNSQVEPVFQKYMELNTDFMHASDAESQAARERVETYMYGEYSKALELLERQYCSEPDDQALGTFLDVLSATSNSAFETPSFVLGKLYICQPDEIVKMIRTLEPEEKRYIVKTLDWGFQNASYGQQDTIENYPELSKRLQVLKDEVE